VEENAALAVESVPAERAERRLRLSRRLVPGVAVLVTVLLAVFAVYFNPARRQPLVEWLYYGSVLVWMLAIRVCYGTVWRRGTFGLLDAVLLGAFLVVFSACWIPYYDDWRWAYTGDSLGYVGLGMQWARGHVQRSFLSAAGGIDNWLTWTQSIAFNWPMLIFEPSFFWHRMGKLFVSLGALAAIYVYLQQVVGRWWALAVVVLLGSNYYWLWVSHVSYEHLDSQIFAYLVLAVFVSIWREPQRYTAWALAGVISGVALFFSRVGWGELVVVGLLLSGYAAVRGHWYGLLIYGISGLIAGLPMIMQLAEVYRGGMQAVRLESGGHQSFAHSLKIMRMILEWPPWQPSFNAGLSGPVFQLPFSYSYLAGGALALLAGIPPLARWLRIPRAVFWIALLLAWEVALLGVTNGRYASPSQNRVYHIVPLQIVLACVPFMLLYNWLRRWLVTRWLVVGLSAASVVVWCYFNAQVLAKPRWRVFGQNTYDGTIEAVQKFGAPIVVFTLRPDHGHSLQNPNEMVNVNYRLHEKVAVSNDYTPQGVREACEYSPVICYELFPEHKKIMEQVLTQVPHEPLELVGTDELRCVRCQ